MEKLVKCKACDKEIAKGVKKCPSCGKDQRNFFQKHKIITGIGVLVIISALSQLGGEDASPTNSTDKKAAATTQSENASVTDAPIIEPLVLTTDDLFDALDKNALKASKTYKEQYVELTGKLTTIDSSGDYFSIGSLTEEFSFASILCNISKEHLDAVMEFEEGQEVTVTGTISDVGEVLGYTVKVESIK